MNIENKIEKIEKIIAQLNEFKQHASFETEKDIIDEAISKMITLWDYNKVK